MTAQRKPAAGDGGLSNTELATPSQDTTGPDFARYGLAGEILAELEPHTEGHPWAILGQFLTMFGNALGGGPHVMVGADRHPCRLFVVVCGPSSIARKGSSLGVVEKVFEHADRGWLYDRRKSGLASGEALIQQFSDNKDDDDDTEGIPRPPDSRLMLIETEFARVLQVAARAGSIVSPVIRQAWDTGTLSNLTRKGAVEARNAHASIIGHITDHELRRELTETDTSNGFANRFLYLQVQRAKRVAMLPPLEDDKAKRLGKLVGSALIEGRKQTRISLSDRSMRLWEVLYAIEEDDPNPLLGVLVGRATAYMLRIAATYAVLDGHDQIEPEHLLAAAELWDYSAGSVGRIFGNRTGSSTADTIADELEKVGEMTRTEISDLFQRHRSKDEIDEALRQLEHLGVIVYAKRHQEHGRPADVVRLSRSLDEVSGIPGTLGRNGYLGPAIASLEAINSLLSLNSQFAVDGDDDERPPTTAKEAKKTSLIDYFEDDGSSERLPSSPIAKSERSEISERSTRIDTVAGSSMSDLFGGDE